MKVICIPQKAYSANCWVEKYYSSLPRHEQIQLYKCGKGMRLKGTAE